MEIRLASPAELELFLECRREFLAEVGQADCPERFWTDTRTYLEDHLRRGDVLILLAMEGETPAAACMACLLETLPLPHCLSGKTAELLNVYTRPNFRRRGYAETLLRRMAAELRGCGVEKLTLFYTDAGYPLYQKLGFVPMERWLEKAL